MKPKISVIIPIFNERENLEPLMKELHHVLSQLNTEYEVLFVDDGSTDGSFNVLEEFARRYPEVKCICFKRKFGQTAAIMAGIDYARGEYIITMDGDLQNDPHDIPRLLQEAEKGYDIVSGWRKKRKDSFLRVYLSKIANKIISRFLEVKLHDYGCSLKVYRADAIKNLHLYGEMHRFIPAVAHWDGAKITEMVVNHRERRFGKSKYNFKRIRAVTLDLIAMKFFTSYIVKPIRVFGRLSFWSFGLGMLSFLKASIDKVFYAQDITDTPYLLISIFLFLVSLQLMSFGLLCEVEVRTYYESQRKKTYKIGKLLNMVESKSLSELEKNTEIIGSAFR